MKAEIAVEINQIKCAYRQKKKVCKKYAKNVNFIKKKCSKKCSKCTLCILTRTFENCARVCPPMTLKYIAASVSVRQPNDTPRHEASASPSCYGSWRTRSQLRKFSSCERQTSSSQGCITSPCRQPLVGPPKGLCSS